MITTYQIRNVLRVYGNQLKRRSALVEDSLLPAQQQADLVDISIDARRRQMVSQMSSRLISTIAPRGEEQKSLSDDVQVEPSPQF